MNEAKHIKQTLISHLIWQRNYYLAVTEGLNKADVFGVQHNFRTYEYEIKVSRSDLKRELDYIDSVTDRQQTIFEQTENGLRFNKRLIADKVKKHAMYLNGTTKYEEWFYGSVFKYDHFIPNYFSFVVEPSLVEYALERLKDSKYGVISATVAFQVHKVARPLHTEEISRDHLAIMTKRTCYENMSLRAMLSEKGYEL